MTAFVEWLAALPNVANVRPCTIIIKSVPYEAARYTATFTTPEGSPAYERGERSNTREMIYALGALPKHYQRRAKAAYTIAGDDREWYIAGYWQGEGVPNQYHPFGSHFLLAPWDLAEKIDAYERKPYDRVTLEVAS